MLVYYLMIETEIDRPGTTHLQIKKAVGALLDDGPAPLAGDQKHTALAQGV